MNQESEKDFKRQGMIISVLLRELSFSLACVTLSLGADFLLAKAGNSIFSEKIPAIVEGLLVHGTTFVTVLVIVMAIYRVYDFLKLPNQPEKSTFSKPAATAIAVLVRYKSRQRSFSLMLLAAAVLGYLLIVSVTGGTISNMMLSVLFLGEVVLVGADIAFTYRVRHGLFGTTEYEARQIIRFVMENSDKYDFSGGIGTTEWSSDQVPQELREVVEGWAVS